MSNRNMLLTVRDWRQRAPTEGAGVRCVAFGRSSVRICIALHLTLLFTVSVSFQEKHSKEAKGWTVFSVLVADNGGGTCENPVLYVDFDRLRVEKENQAGGKDRSRVSYFFCSG
jgi:hypothetical protein